VPEYWIVDVISEVVVEAHTQSGRTTADSVDTGRRGRRALSAGQDRA